MSRWRKTLWLLTGGAALGLLTLAAPTPRLIWNATASAPEGLYALQPARAWGRGDLVAVQPDPQLAGWMDARGYAPSGVLLIKHVAALSPSRVCRDGARITIDQVVMALAEPRDRAGRPLPVWSGCRVLDPTDVFLLNPAKGSLDSRYLGSLPRKSVAGRVAPIWLISDTRHAP
jgi:type IV secretory pathway protease TraF